jgi:hypothetical protein
MRAAALVIAASGLTSLGGCGGSPPPAPSNHAAADTAAPDLETLRTMLAGHPAKLDDQRGCEVSLGDWVKLLVKNGSPTPDGDIHRLTGGCGAFPATHLPIDPPPDPAYWFCTIDSYTSDPGGESPWHYAVHLRIRKADRAIDVATIACPGA